MGASATRPGINRWNREHGYWKPRQPDPVVAEQATAQAAANAETLRAEPPFVRVEHPVIDNPIWTRPFCVQRRVRTRDGLLLETIGETRSLGEALSIARTEQWAAIVTDKNGKAVHFNWQPELRRA